MQRMQLDLLADSNPHLALQHHLPVVTTSHSPPPQSTSARSLPFPSAHASHHLSDLHPFGNLLCLDSFLSLPEEFPLILWDASSRDTSGKYPLPLRESTPSAGTAVHRGLQCGFQGFCLFVCLFPPGCLASSPDWVLEGMTLTLITSLLNST